MTTTSDISPKRSIDFTGKVQDINATTNPSSICDISQHIVTKKSHRKSTEKCDDDNETLKTTKDLESQQEADSQVEQPQQATLTAVSDFSVYEGSTLEEQLESFIASHSVVMFNKTWCLFSVDAQNFMIHQMNVHVHCCQVDLHPQGKAILQYIHGKTKHDTVPVIFIKGEFLGGFSDVNALYATGKLQDDYLQGLRVTQADRCETFIQQGTNLATQPLFWFPATVNAHVVRITGVLTSLIAIVSAILVHWKPMAGRYIAYGLCLDFLFRVLAGSKLSLVGRIATVLASPSCLPPKPRSGRPKQFASMCGLIFSGLGTLFYLTPFAHHDIVGAAFMAGLACASGMEGFLDFCLGCVFFKYGILLGLIPK